MNAVNYGSRNMTRPHNINMNSRVSALRPTAVNRVLHEAAQLQARGRSLVSLARGQPDTPTAGHIVEAAQRALRDGRTGYPDNRGEPALRRAIARKLQHQHGLVYDADHEILVTDGATGAFATALGALVGPGDDVLLPDPVYDAYHSPIALWGARPVSVRAAVCGGRFTIERSALEAACTPRSRVLLLNTPWNPVGTVFTRAELEELVQFATERRLLIVSDEIYEALVYDGRVHVSPVVLGDDARSRTLMINSLSKTYAMTGWRVGYCAGPAALVDAMFLVWQQSSRGPATFVQDAAAGALGSDQTCVASMRAEYEGRRDRVVQALRGLPDIVPLVPEGGLFVMVDVSELGMPSDEIRRSLLEEEGVVLVHGAAYGAGGEGTLRVSFASGGEVLEEGLERLRKGLQRLAVARRPAQEAPR